ncbi:MAG: MATE family efflux transporter, partial [Planctomycetota bacterium]
PAELFRRGFFVAADGGGFVSSTAVKSQPKRAESDALELLKLALPIIGMTVSRMLMGFIDFVMVSQLGTEAQAAISPATIFVFAGACLGMGAATSVQTFVSQADGRGDARQAGSYVWQVVYISMLFALVTPAVAAGTPKWFGALAAWSHTPPAVAALEIDYMRIALWSIPFAVLCAGLNGFFNGVQRPMMALWATLVSLVVNVVGNWLLIFGNLGFPEMGIAGAAVATVLSWATRAALMFWIMLWPSFDRRFVTRRAMVFDWRKFKAIWRVGGPTAVQWVVDIGAWVVFLNVIMPPYGPVAMAASNVALQYMHVSFMPAIGIGMALCSQVGFAIGERRPERAVRKARVAMQVTGLYMGAVGLVFWLAGAPLMRLLSDDPAVIEIGRIVLVWAAVFQVFDAMGITYMNALRGAGDTFWPAVFVGVCCWVIFVGGGVVSPALIPAWTVSGPWLFCTAYISILGIALWLRWRLGSWRGIRLQEDVASPAAPHAAPIGADELECGVPDPLAGTVGAASASGSDDACTPRDR